MHASLITAILQSNISVHFRIEYVNECILSRLSSKDIYIVGPVIALTMNTKTGQTRPKICEIWFVMQVRQKKEVFVDCCSLWNILIGIHRVIIKSRRYIGASLRFESNYYVIRVVFIGRKYFLTNTIPSECVFDNTY